LTYKVAQEIHPNNELRLTLWRVRNSHESIKAQAASYLDVAADSVADLASSNPNQNPQLDIRSEFRTPPITCSYHAYARTAFGLDAKRRIMRAAGAMDRNDSEIGNYLFLTATLPGDTEEAKFAIANYSHLLIHRLKMWLSKRLSDRLEFYVWEHQKRGALHFHYCIHVPDEDTKLNIEKGFKGKWASLLDGLELEFGCNLWGKWAHHSARYRTAIVQARVERVYKSVGAYMAGYLSGKGDKHERDKSIPYYPKRWFGVSRPLSTLIKNHSEKQIHEFTTHREATEFYAKKEDDFLDEVLTHTQYPHKVGEGKTHVFYHAQEKQSELWQEVRMLAHSKTDHPVISSLIQAVLYATNDGFRMHNDYKRSQTRHSVALSQYLEDGTWLTSLRKGAINQTHIRMMDEAYSAFDWSSDSHYRSVAFTKSLKKAVLLISLYQPQMRWNQFGWLNNQNDFAELIDETQEVCQAGTSAERRSDTTGELEPRGLVPNDSKPVPSQLELL